MIRVFGIAVLWLLLIHKAYAGLTLEQYRASRHSPDIRAQVDSYIHGYGRGLWWGSGLQQESRFFCLPQSKQLDKDLILSLVDQEIRNPSVPEGEWSNEAFIEYILIKSLTGRFPCHKDGKPLTGK